MNTIKRRMAVEPFLTPAELAERWRVHKSTVSRFIQSGELSAMRVGRQLRIKISVIEHFEKFSSRRAAA